MRTPMYEAEINEQNAAYVEDLAADMIEAVGKDDAVTVCLYLLETLLDLNGANGASIDLNHGVQMHVIRHVIGAIHDS